MTIESYTVVRAATPSRRHFYTFLSLLALWWTLLAAFYLTPQLDLAVARAFFTPFACAEGQDVTRVCGHFPYKNETIFAIIRSLFFYMPSLIALTVLWMLIKSLQHHGATYDQRKTSRLGVALLAFAAGPYLLVNLALKSFSGRPRPYETDVFGGDLTFAPAGSFAGGCTNNCSFISGEAAGGGWMVCLILLLPPALRPSLAPPLLAISVVTPALRVAFGGHYLSDAVLGWLSSPVIFFGFLALSETTRLRKKTYGLTQN